MPYDGWGMDLSLGIDPQHLKAALQWAQAAYQSCDVCAARCGVDRTNGPAGVCGLGEDARIYKEYLHFGEEAALVPSHTIFMTGCNFRCVFCSDDRFVRRPLDFGTVVPPEALAVRIAQRRSEGATNVNFVGGVPDVNVLYILRTLQHCPPDTHVVWNTNLWSTTEALSHLEGVVGTWLVDYKFGNDRCALKLAGGIELGNHVGAVVIDPRHPGIIYAGTRSAGLSYIWRSVDGGENWKDISCDLPRSGVYALAVHPLTGDLMHGTPYGTWLFPPPYASPHSIYMKSGILP